MREKKILMNYLLYVLLFVVTCMVGISNVFAISYNNIGYVHQMTGTSSQVLIEPTYTTTSGGPLTITREQVVYTQIKILNVYVNNYSFVANRQYQIEMEFPNSQLIYANTYEVYGSNNELCTLSYTDSNFTSQWARWNFSCPTNTSSIYLKIYNSNNGAITNMANWSWNYIYLRYSDTPINSDTQDTDTIINNNNMNTDRIIDNQNQNTQDIIDSNKVCDNLNIEYQKGGSYGLLSYYLNDSGTLVSGSNQWYVSDYVGISENETYNLYYSYNPGTSNYCLYDSNKNLLSCTRGSQGTTSIVPTQNGFIRFSLNLYLNNATTRFVGKVCKNGNQALNDTLNDDDVDTSQASDFFSNFSDNTHGLSGIISAPLTAINQLLNDQCSPLSATWEGKTVSLPCGYEMWQRFSSFKQFLNIVIDGLICYRILLKLFKLVEKFKNPNDDRVEVMDL